MRKIGILLYNHSAEEWQIWQGHKQQKLEQEDYLEIKFDAKYHEATIKLREQETFGYRETLATAHFQQGTAFDLNQQEVYKIRTYT